MEIRFDLCPSLSHRDPQETELGRKIIEFSIILIEKIGFEAFTFKKLANEIGSTEKSIYRYLRISTFYWCF